MSKVLVLTSYCGAEDNNGCTDTNPCRDCMEMSNVYEADLSNAEYLAELDNLRRGLGKFRREIYKTPYCDCGHTSHGLCPVCLTLARLPPTKPDSNGDRS